MREEYVGGAVAQCQTLAASTIFAVASANSLAADSSLREFSKSDSPSASILMALTRSEVAWARIRACLTISPERGKGEEGEKEMLTGRKRGKREGQWKKRQSKKGVLRNRVG